MKRFLSLLFVVTLTGFDIPPQNETRVSPILTDRISSENLRCSVVPNDDRQSILDPLKFSSKNNLTKSFCVLQDGASKKQREAFDDCIVKLGGCDKSFDRNEGGDYLVQCGEVE